MTRARSSLRAVAFMELAKGVLVLIAAGLMAGLLPGELQRGTEALVRHFHMNPARADPQVLVEALRQFVNVHKLALATGAIFYAAVRFVEAYGLWHGRTWAWGFGVISAALYIPLELVELSRGVTAPGLAVLTVNVLVVLLLWQARGNTA